MPLEVQPLPGGQPATSMSQKKRVNVHDRIRMPTRLVMAAGSATLLTIIALIVFALGQGHNKKRQAEASLTRTISWSGYSWNVRPAGMAQPPGPNDWSDSTANVQVQGSDLLLSVARDSSANWTSSEVENQKHLGYGTYRWVVATDLSSLDANEVLGMFTYGGSDPSNNEIDVEASHWGDMSNPTGTATVWQNANAGLSEGRVFSYSSRPPYVNQFTWSPGRIEFLVTDATGARLFAWTVTTGVPTPSTEVPVINHWRFNNVAPASVRTIRISSFAWAPLGQSLPPATH